MTQSSSAPHIIIMMGPAAAGKTFFGKKLAQTLNWELYECDDAHPKANKDKMRAGIPLTDMEEPDASEAISINTAASDLEVLDAILNRLCSIGLARSCHLMSQNNGPA